VLTTWYRGRRITAERIISRNVLLDDFIAKWRANPGMRGPGVGVYMGSNPSTVPQALSSHYRHAGVLPEHVCVMAVLINDVPHVPRSEQLQVIDLGDGFHQILHHVGFMDDLDIPRVLAEQGEEKSGLDFSKASYVLGRETLRVTKRPGMAMWRERLFVLMLRNANPADVFFKLPPEQTIELGVQVNL
jgi:KUP system potassium uptake protein